MPSRGRKFITEFLLPSLNEKKFGVRLMWLDIENKVFQMQWNHKSAADWTTSDAAVFAAWDQKKGHYKPDDKEYYTKSKQRFRAALYKFIKLKLITELYSEDKYTKIYCIGEGQNISKTYVTAVRSEKENEGNENTFQNFKKNPEDLVLNLNPIWDADLLTEPLENSLVACHNHEIANECFIEEEQVVADGISEFIPDLLHSENSQNNFLFLNSLRDNKKKIGEESDVKSLLLIPETYICKKDNLLKRVVTITNDNCNDYLCTLMDTSTKMEWPIHEFNETDGDFSCQLLNTYN